MASERGAGSPASARTDPTEEIRCARCEAAVPRGESKACAICRQLICPACTRPYGHFMLVCDECRLAPW